jgi:acyl-CoA synthetase (NDP forming)
MKAAYEKAGYLVFEEPARAVAALAAVARIAEGFCQALPAPYFARARSIVPGQVFNEVQAKAALAAIGVRTPAEIFVADEAEATRKSGALKGKLALKIVSGDLAHKSVSCF